MDKLIPMELKIWCLTCKRPTYFSRGITTPGGHNICLTCQVHPGNCVGCK